ncbi:MAG: BatD family protein [Stutzerimonas stutzeri]
MYDPVHSEQVTTPLSGMQGKIADKYTIIPQYQGNYTIKGLTFSYFDLSTKTYKTITSNDIVIKVLDGPTSSDSSVAATPGAVTNKQAVKSTNQFRFIALKTQLHSTHKEDFFGSGLFYTLLFLPFLFFL